MTPEVIMKNRTDSQVRRPVFVPRFYFTRFIVPLVLTGLAFSSIATAATVTLAPSMDATIFSAGGVNGIGNLFVGTSGTLLPATTTERRALLNFDLSDIPSNAVITNATLTLLVLSSQGTDTGSLHRLLQDWAEGDQPGLGFAGGQPSAAVGDNDVTWTVTGLGSTWTSAGADFVPGASASAALPVIVLPAATPIPVSFSDAGMVSDVQGWVDGSFGNSGWILTGSSTISNVRKLASREAVSGQPQLSVTYNVIPVPAAVWLFGSALGLLGWLRRKTA